MNRKFDVDIDDIYRDKNIDLTISSLQDSVMTRLINSDEIVRAVGITTRDFMSNEYKIEEVSTKWILTRDDDGLIFDENKNILYRYHLPYNKITPFLYDDETLTDVTTLIQYDIFKNEASDFFNRSRNRNTGEQRYEVIIRIFVHHNSMKTNYGKTRPVFISEFIRYEMEKERLGTENNKTLYSPKLVFDEPRQLYNGKWHGRNMLFTGTIFSDENCHS